MSAITEVCFFLVFEYFYSLEMRESLIDKWIWSKWSRLLLALTVGLLRLLDFLLSLWRTMQLRVAALLTMAVENSADAGDWWESRRKRSQHTQTSLAKSSFSTLFPMVPSLADWVAPSPLSQHNSPPIFKFHSSIHELILLMSEQCTNSGPPYPCPVCLCP